MFIYNNVFIAVIMPQKAAIREEIATNKDVIASRVKTNPFSGASGNILVISFLTTKNKSLKKFINK